MKEDESNWFSRWDEQLPSSVEELIPLSQTLITPHLALSSSISTTPNSQSTPPAPLSVGHPPNSSDFEYSGDLRSGSEGARSLKRPRLVWTSQLHKRFMDAVGIKDCCAQNYIADDDGLTRENVASHLQMYRLYLKRMQGHTNGAGFPSSDPATDHLFATLPVQPHFLHPGQDHCMPFVAPPQHGRPIWVTHLYR